LAYAVLYASEIPPYMSITRDRYNWITRHRYNWPGHL